MEFNELLEKANRVVIQCEDAVVAARMSANSIYRGSGVDLLVGAQIHLAQTQAWESVAKAEVALIGAYVSLMGVTVMNTLNGKMGDL